MSEHKQCLPIPTGIIGSLCQVGCEEIYNEDLFFEDYELAEILYQSLEETPSDKSQSPQQPEGDKG